MTCLMRWKLTNEAETHNGLRYHDGLVVDPLPFNDDPSASCCPGGIYFAGRDTLAFIEGMAVLSAEIALCEHDYIHSKMANNYQQALLQTEIADGNEKH